MIVFPKLEKLPSKEIYISEFKGINRSPSALETDIYEAYNISSSAIPKIKSRGGRKKVFSAPYGEEITALFQFDKIYATTAFGPITRIFRGDDISSLSLFYTANVDDTVTTTMCKFGDSLCVFNLKQLDGEYEMNVITASDPSKQKRVTLPYFADVLVYKNRIFGCRSRQICACAYNDATNWNANEQREDIENIAIAKSQRTATNLLCCTTYKDMALFFTSDEMYCLKGDNSQDFRLEKIANIGCLDKNAICECNGDLYFMSRKGLARYNAGSVKIVSDIMCKEAAVAEKSLLCAGNNSVYINISGSEKHSIFVYNTESQAVVTEDDFKPNCAATIFSKAYFVEGIDVYEFDAPYIEGEQNNDGAGVLWTVTTQRICDFLPNRSRGTKLSLGMCLEEGSRLEVWADFDDSGYQVIYTGLQGCKEVCIPLPITDFNSVRIRINGYGKGEIHYIKLCCHKGAEGR